MISNIGRWLQYFVSNFIVMVAAVFCRIGIAKAFFQSLIAANSLGKASQAYKNKQYIKAYNAVKDVAEYDIHDPYVGSSQYLVGLLYFYGRGIEQNQELANLYFKKAADRGNEDAILHLKNIKPNTT
jgi:TPR repeat protein